MSDKAMRERLEEAMDRVEDSNVEPSRRQPASFSAQLFNLKVGETASRAVVLDEHLLLSEMKAISDKTASDLRDGVLPMVSRLKRREPDRDFTSASGMLIASDGRAYVAIFVTRIA